MKRMKKFLIISANNISEFYKIDIILLLAGSSKKEQYEMI